MGELQELMHTHLGELAREYCVEFVYGNPSDPGLPETDARTYFRGAAGPKIMAPPLRTRRHYFAALHEFGHVACGHEFHRKADALENEAEAWQWALDHSRLEPTLTVWRLIDGCLLDHALRLGIAMGEGPLRAALYERIRQGCRAPEGA